MGEEKPSQAPVSAWGDPDTETLASNREEALSWLCRFADALEWGQGRGDNETSPLDVKRIRACVASLRSALNVYEDTEVVARVDPEGLRLIGWRVESNDPQLAGRPFAVWDRERLENYLSQGGRWSIEEMYKRV